MAYPARAQDVVAPAESSDMVLQPGQQVSLQGLLKAPDLNGKNGVILRYVEKDERYAVLVEGREKELAIKRTNLQMLEGVVEVPKPQSAPTPVSATKKKEDKFMQKVYGIHAEDIGPRDKFKKIEKLIDQKEKEQMSVPGAGPKKDFWSGSLRAGQMLMVRSEVKEEQSEVPLWQGDVGFVQSAPVDVAFLISEMQEKNIDDWPAALGRAVKNFPVSTGRLKRKKVGENITWSIRCNNAGIPFTIAQVAPGQLPTAKRLQQYCLEEDGLFDIGPVGGQPMDETPLLRLKLTTEAGSSRAVLGLSFRHVLCDIVGLSSLLGWWLAELRGEKPPEQSCHDRAAAEKVYNAISDAAEEEEKEVQFKSLWPLGSKALIRWCFMARRIRYGLRGPPDLPGTMAISFPSQVVTHLRAEARAGGAPEASGFDAVTGFLVSRLRSSGRPTPGVLLTKEYRQELAEAAPGCGLNRLFANAVTHSIFCSIPETEGTGVARAVERKAAALRAAKIKSSLGSFSLNYERWQRNQPHNVGLVNFFGGLCCNSWGNMLSDLGFAEAYALGRGSIDERANNMCGILDTGYAQYLPQPDGSQMALITLPMSHLKELRGALQPGPSVRLPSPGIELPFLGDIRGHQNARPLGGILPEEHREALKGTPSILTPRVLCLGDSLTFCGYPKYLQEMLDTANIRCDVRDGGTPSATAIDKGAFSYMYTSACAKAYEIYPVDVLVMLFGTNDTKIVPGIDGFWDVRTFEKDYAALIHKFRIRRPEPEVFLVAPPPLHDPARGSKLPDGMQPDIVSGELQKAVKRIAESNNATVIDAYSHMGGEGALRRDYFAEDGCHPNERGCKLLALLVKSAIRVEIEKRLKSKPKVATDFQGAGI